MLAARSAWALLRTYRGDPLRGEHLGPVTKLLPASFAGAFGDTEPPGRLREMARRFLDRLTLDRLDHDELLRGGRCQEVRNLEALHALRRSGTGMVVCSLHFGPFYYIPVEVAWAGWKVQALMLGQLHEQLAPRFLELAARSGLDFEPLASRSVRSVVGCVRGLQAGQALVVYSDGQNTAAARPEQAGHDVAVDVLGMPLRILAGPAWLSACAGVPMVPALVWREGLGRRVMEFGDPLPAPRDRSMTALAEATRALFAWFEPRIRARPETWGFWAYPFLMWREAGDSPSVGVEQWRATLARVTALLESGRGRLRAESAHVGVHRGQRLLIVHGPTRRVLVGDALSCDVLEAALDGARLSELARSVQAPPEALAGAVARLTLAGLARLDER
jgi:lauroyl/myristoyl acyltransferase